MDALKELRNSFRIKSNSSRSNSDLTKEEPILDFRPASTRTSNVSDVITPKEKLENAEKARRETGEGAMLGNVQWVNDPNGGQRALIRPVVKVGSAPPPLPIAKGKKTADMYGKTPDERARNAIKVIEETIEKEMKELEAIEKKIRDTGKHSSSSENNLQQHKQQHPDDELL